MNPAEYQRHDATALAALVQSGDVFPAELATLAGQAHRATHKHINAVVEWYDEPSLPTAEFGRSLTGPLAGVPFLRKDYGSAEQGRLVEMGSRLAAGNRATFTAEYIRRLHNAGVQILGRTATPEFIQHGSTESAVNGATRNPHDLTISSGGSSGGAASAVAAGVVPAAHASDCAGSIRIPASTCGLIGLKPGRYRVPWPGATASNPGAWGGIASEFVVTRSLRDAALFLDVLADEDRSGPAGSVGSAGLSDRAGSGGTTGRPLRIACSTDHWAGLETEPAVLEATLRAADQLRHAGHDVELVESPVDYDQLMETWYPLFIRWVGVDIEALIAAGHQITPDCLEQLTRLAWQTVQQLTPADLSAAETTAAAITSRLDQHLTGFDAILNPTLARSVIPLGEIAGEVKDLDRYLELNNEIFPYNYLFNLTGWPSLSVPAGTTASGHPIGVQLSGRLGTERLLLHTAEAIVGPGVVPVATGPRS